MIFALQDVVFTELPGESPPGAGAPEGSGTGTADGTLDGIGEGAFVGVDAGLGGNEEEGSVLGTV